MWSSKFVVVTVWCDGDSKETTHSLVEDAVAEYVSGMTLAIEPPTAEQAKNYGELGLNVTPKHVRQVNMLVYDEDNNLVHHIDTGIFGCEHRVHTGV